MIYVVLRRSELTPNMFVKISLYRETTHLIVPTSGLFFRQPKTKPSIIEKRKNGWVCGSNSNGYLTTWTGRGGPTRYAILELHAEEHCSMRREPMTADFIREHRLAVPPVRVRMVEHGNIVERNGWVRWCKSTHNFYVIVHRPYGGPLFVEKSESAILRAVNQEEVIVE